MRKLQNFKGELRKTYAMSDMGLLHYYVGIQFQQKDEKLLRRFNMADCKPMATPMETNSKLSINKNMAKFSDANLYCQELDA